jgi:hypothetical protein
LLAAAILASVEVAEDLGFVSPKCSAVIARQRVRPLAGPMTGSGGRSSNRQAIITGCPAFAGHDSPVAKADAARLI